MAIWTWSEKRVIVFCAKKTVLHKTSKTSILVFLNKQLETNYNIVCFQNEWCTSEAQSPDWYSGPTAIPCLFPRILFSTMMPHFLLDENDPSNMKSEDGSVMPVWLQCLIWGEIYFLWEVNSWQQLESHIIFLWDSKPEMPTHSCTYVCCKETMRRWARGLTAILSAYNNTA